MKQYILNDHNLVIDTDGRNFFFFLWGYMDGWFESHLTCKIENNTKRDFCYLISKTEKPIPYVIMKIDNRTHVVIDFQEKTEIADVLEIITGYHYKEAF